MPVTRRHWLGLAGGTALVAAMSGRNALRRTRATPAVTGIPLTLHASAACECCHTWASHLSAQGFRVTKRVLANVDAIKDALGVPAALRSCHTAEVAGYVVEGHVPAGILRRFLQKQRTEIGLAAPGMPGGSPGLESTPKAPFDVMAFGRDGASRVYARA
jgi:hypothetical protein